MTGIRQVTGAIRCLPSSGVGGRDCPPGGCGGSRMPCTGKRHAGPRGSGSGRRGACLCTAWRNAGAVTGLEQRNALARGLLPLSLFCNGKMLITTIRRFQSGIRLELITYCMNNYQPSFRTASETTVLLLPCSCAQMAHFIPASKSNAAIRTMAASNTTL